MQCIAVCCSKQRCRKHDKRDGMSCFIEMNRAAVCCSAMQCVAVRCSALQYVAARCSALQCVAARCSALQRVAERCSTSQRVAVRCNALQRVAVRCSALQCVAARCSALCVHDASRSQETREMAFLHVDCKKSPHPGGGSFLGSLKSSDEEVLFLRPIHLETI